MGDNIKALRKRGTQLIEFMAGPISAPIQDYLIKRTEAQQEYHEISEDLRALGLRLVIAVREIK